MNDVRREIARLRFKLRLLTAIALVGAAFDIWELFRLVAVIKGMLPW